jgi:hypothetical protein
MVKSNKVQEADCATSTNAPLVATRPCADRPRCSFSVLFDASNNSTGQASSDAQSFYLYVFLSSICSDFCRDFSLQPYY